MKHLTLFIPGFFGWCGIGGIHPHLVTPLSFKSDDSDFVQMVGSIFWGKKNWDQIDNDETMTSILL